MQLIHGHFGGDAMGTYREVRLGAARTHLARGLAGASLLALGIASAGAGATTLNYDGMIQIYSVLDTGIYDITAAGAQGGIGGTSSGGAIGGRGAVGGGDISLDAGTTLYVVVGGRGGNGIGVGAGGGGGMSAVYILTGGNATPFLVPGGGGGGGGPGVVIGGGSADGGSPGDGSGGCCDDDGGGGAGFGRPPDYSGTSGNGGSGIPSGAAGGHGYADFAGGVGGVNVPAKATAGLAAAAVVAFSVAAAGVATPAAGAGTLAVASPAAPIFHRLSSMSRRSTH